jgi:hypothetical protein
LASLSVLTKGNPRVYKLESAKATYEEKEKKKKTFKVTELDIFFSGADLKQGRFIFEDHPQYRGVTIREAKLESGGGVFKCKGFMVLFKDKNSFEPVTFPMDLEPIKNGFKLKANFKGMNIEATLKKE